MRHGAILIAPGDNTLIGPADQLLVIADDSNNALREARTAATPRRVTTEGEIRSALRWAPRQTAWDRPPLLPGLI